MNKDQLKQELLAKIKQGIKPSQLKKPRKASQTSTPASSPPTSPIIVPVDKKTKPNITNRNKSPSKNTDETLINQLQEQVDFWSQTAQNHLTNLQRATAENDYLQEQIKELKNQPNQLSQAAEQALKEANQKIRELEAKNKQLKENITQLENRAKTTAETKEIGTQTSPQPKTYLFTCGICEQNKKSQLHLAKVNGLGINPHKQNKICDACIRKVDIIKPKEEEFF